jgi:hypothetical protein
MSLGLPHAVQIDAGLDIDVAAAQLPHRLRIKWIEIGSLAFCRCRRRRGNDLRFLILMVRLQREHGLGERFFILEGLVHARLGAL